MIYPVAQPGGHGGHDPHPKLLVNVFFWRLPMHFRLTTLKIGPPNVTWPIFVEFFFAQGSTHYSTDCWSADTEKILPLPPPTKSGVTANFCYYPPQSGRLLAITEKVAPPKKNHGYAGGYITTTKHMSDSHILKVTFQDQSCETFLSTPRMLARTNTSQNNLKNM